MLEIQIDFTEILITKEIQKKILLQVGKDVIKEIKKLIKNGKNIFNEDLISKNNKEVPDFHDTGLLLKSLDCKVENDNLIIFVNNASRYKVLYDLQNRKGKNWVLIEYSDYIANFITKKYDKYLEIELNK